MVNPLISRFQVWVVQLDPTRGREIKKTRPCVVVSPDELSLLSTVLVAPMTTKGFDYPCRIQCQFQSKQGKILLDQIRLVDKTRLVRKLGMIRLSTQIEICALLQEMFAY